MKIYKKPSLLLIREVDIGNVVVHFHGERKLILVVIGTVHHIDSVRFNLVQVSEQCLFFACLNSADLNVQDLMQTRNKLIVSFQLMKCDNQFVVLRENAFQGEFRNFL